MQTSSLHTIKVSLSEVRQYIYIAFWTIVLVWKVIWNRILFTESITLCASKILTMVSYQNGLVIMVIIIDSLDIYVYIYIYNYIDKKRFEEPKSGRYF